MTIEERIEKGSPKKWNRKKLCDVLSRNAAAAIFTSLLPVLGQILLFSSVIMLTPLSEGYGCHCVDDESAEYGVNNAEESDTTMRFRVIYIMIWVILACVSLGLFYGLGVQQISSKFLAAVLSIYFMFCLGIIVALQIYGVVTFKYWIREYACRKCHYVNTMEYIGDGGKEIKEIEYKESSTKSGEHRTHTVYVDGKAVGGIYARHSGYDHYVTDQVTSQIQHYRCSNCGYIANIDKVLESKCIRERYEKNNR